MPNVNFDNNIDPFKGKINKLFLLEYEVFKYQGPKDLMIAGRTFDSDKHLESFLHKVQNAKNIEFRECNFYG